SSDSMCYSEYESMFRKKTRFDQTQMKSVKIQMAEEVEIAVVESINQKKKYSAMLELWSEQSSGFPSQKDD
ncbi:hypothetical protein CDAR_40771, partial [Caerostris darwini]